MKENQILGNLIQQMRKEMKMRSVDAARTAQAEIQKFTFKTP